MCPRKATRAFGLGGLFTICYHEPLLFFAIEAKARGYVAMSYSSPPPALPQHMQSYQHQTSQYDSTNPPPPPPKPQSHEPSQRSTPLTLGDGISPPPPPLPPNFASQPGYQAEPQRPSTQAQRVVTPEAWLPDMLKEHSYIHP